MSRPKTVEFNFNSDKEYLEFCEDNKIRFGPFYPATIQHNNPFSKGGVDIDPDEIWKNNLYQVSIFKENTVPEGWPDLIHLSLKRLDREPIHDWRDLQLIKNELVGPNHEAVELYPAESRLVDSANQYHLFVIADPEIGFPFGFGKRFVDDGEGCGTKQKPWLPSERPDDCSRLSDKELIDQALEEEKDRKSNQNGSS